MVAVGVQKRCTQREDLHFAFKELNADREKRHEPKSANTLKRQQYDYLQGAD